MDKPKRNLEWKLRLLVMLGTRTWLGFWVFALKELTGNYTVFVYILFGVQLNIRFFIFLLLLYMNQQWKFRVNFRLLVYEYVNNGNLEQWLHGAMRQYGYLTWEARIKILLGTAKAYVHLVNILESSFLLLVSFILLILRLSCTQAGILARSN